MSKIDWAKNKKNSMPKVSYFGLSCDGGDADIVHSDEKFVFVKCKICGFKVYNLKKHITRLHTEELKCLTKDEKDEVRQEIEA